MTIQPTDRRGRATTPADKRSVDQTAPDSRSRTFAVRCYKISGRAVEFSRYEFRAMADAVADRLLALGARVDVVEVQA